MKKFLIRLLFFIPIPIIIIAVNYFEDPANLFNKKYELGITDYLVQGYHVTNVLNYDERLLQKLFIQKMKECPNEIAIGSSTMMMVNSTYTQEPKFINNGVSGSGLEDEVAIYSLYEEKGCHLKKIILGADPWLLNKDQDVRWKTLGNEYYSLLKKIINNPSIDTDFTSSKDARFKQLLSLSYFKTSFDYFIKGINKKYRPTNVAANKGLTRLKDGAILYDADFRDASPKTVERKAKKAIASIPMFHYNDFFELSEKNKVILAKFIEYLQGKNIDVELFLAPYHPIVYNYFKQTNYYHVVFEAENFYKELAVNYKLKIIGSYDPEKYGLDNSFFLDGVHCNEKGLKKIFNQENK